MSTNYRDWEPQVIVKLIQHNIRDAHPNLVNTYNFGSRLIPKYRRGFTL